MNLQIPGKTFLVGEYAVLVGGSALGIATRPYFKEGMDVAEYHPMSAAGLLSSKYEDKSYKLKKIVSPYLSGGFGLSTAEFISSWFAIKHIDPNSEQSIKVLSSIFTDYRRLFDLNTNTRLLKPSGADLIIQMLGNITYFESNITKCESLKWPFTDLGFYIISTGLKIQTHEHLSNLNISSLVSLPAAADKVINAFRSVDEELFLAELKNWSKALLDLDLQHNNSLRLKIELECSLEILMAKPNGALGADTITLFYRNKDANKVRLKLNELNLKIIASHNELGNGVMHVD